MPEFTTFVLTYLFGSINMTGSFELSDPRLGSVAIQTYQGEKGQCGIASQRIATSSEFFSYISFDKVVETYQTLSEKSGVLTPGKRGFYGGYAASVSRDDLGAPAVFILTEDVKITVSIMGASDSAKPRQMFCKHETCMCSDTKVSK